MNPGVIALALGGYAIFLTASWLSWAFGYTALLIVVVYGVSAMYFGMLLHYGRCSAAYRGDNLMRSFRQFRDGRVQTFTGWMSSRSALVQIAFMLILLGCTMCFSAVLWLSVR